MSENSACANVFCILYPTINKLYIYMIKCVTSFFVVHFPRGAPQALGKLEKSGKNKKIEKISKY